MRHIPPPTVLVLCLLLPLPALAVSGHGLPVIHIPERAVPEREFTLDELALGLDEAPPDVRADLARIALEELAATYAREAERARNGRGDTQRWAHAVRQLAGNMAALADSVTSVSRVELGIGAEHSIYMTMDGNPVVVNGPRPDEQDELEQRIVARFCNLHPCARLLPEAAPDQATAVQPPLIATLRWRFSAGSGPVCLSDDGLAFQFDDTTELNLKRLACARAVTELDRLADALARYRARGTRIEWDQLAIEQPPGREQHQVRLNRDGEYLQLPLPTLFGSPELFRQVRPWLVARVNGGSRDTRIEHAGRLLLGH